MNTQSSFDAIDTRFVFRAYAVVACAAGLVLYGNGNFAFQGPLEGVPFSGRVAARMAGAIAFAAGLLAEAMARTSDEDARRSALAWWGTAHLVAFLGIGLQASAVVGLENVGWAALAFLGSVLFAGGFFLFSRYTVDGMPIPGPFRPHDSVLRELRAASVQRLRSTYEEQIRAAASQEERHRLARDLHDSIKQQLFVIQTAAATAQARSASDPSGAGAAVAQVRDSAREAMAEMEAMLDQLRASPLENSGLVEALKKQCEALRFRTGADVQFSVGELPPSENLPAGAQQALFRVAQEALANVGRHARATHVSVTLDSTPLSIQLRVADDGVGFDTEQPAAGMGLTNMRARVEPFGGTVVVTTAPGKGTQLRASLPQNPVTGEADVADYRRQALLYGGFCVLWGVGSLLWGTGSLLHSVQAHRPDLAAWAVLVAFNIMLFVRAALAWRRARRAVANALRQGGAQ